MEAKFNFNSQVCTSKEQSERLLALGLKKETADMVLCEPFDYEKRKYSEGYVKIVLEEGEGFCKDDIPAWSLHRLIEMMPDLIKDNIEGMLYHLSIDGNSVFYETRNNDLCQFFGDSLYNCIIDCIEWLIKEGYFNKEYLV